MSSFLNNLFKMKETWQLRLAEYVGNLALLPAALWGLYNIPFFAILWILYVFDFRIPDAALHKRGTESINWKGIIAVTAVSTFFWFGQIILELLF